MISITINQSAAPSGATTWSLSPALISLGGRDANHVDTIQFSGVPEAWAGMTIRATFVPVQLGAAATAIVLDDTRQIIVPQAITQHQGGGKLLLDATDGTYHAYTRSADYAAGTPVTIVYQLATPTDTAGTGNAITVSGDTVVAAENTVAVTYNKSLIAAISQLQTAIAALGTT